MTLALEINHRLPSAAYGRNQRRVEGWKGGRVEKAKKQEIERYVVQIALNDKK